MYIKSLKIKGFRNYAEEDFEFNKKVNIFLGKNGQGKTNVLESLYVSSYGRSFRTNRDTEMIGFGCENCKIDVEACKKDYDTETNLIISKDSKKYAKIDGVKVRNTSEMLNNILVVIFSPEDLKIVKEEPEKRRKFIDRELCQINPSYFNILSDYKRVLAQRNINLKEDKIDEAFLDVMDTKMSDLGAKIISYRNNFVRKINSVSKKIHKKITNGKEELEIKYDPNIEYLSDIEEQKKLYYYTLKKSFENDMRLRTTTKGLHKDDLDFFINDINVRNFGSQGQQRTAALSLKLAEISIIEDETGEIPVLLLDDVMSELDIERQEFLVKSLEDVQMFITTTDLQNEFLDKFSEKRVFYIEKGKVVK